MHSMQVEPLEEALGDNMITVNGEKINVTMFPDGASQVWKLPIIETKPSKFDIEWNFESEGEIFHLAQLVRLIRQARVPVPINLHMPYLPYGRQDKEVGNDKTFALRVFSSMIKDMSFAKISTVDAHSDLLERILPNFINYYPDKGIFTSYAETCANMLAFPDKGASKKYTDIGQYPAIIGDKVRDQLTGYITSYNIEGDPRGKNVLIVDDLCDGGMTFILLAKELLTAGANSVNLYVSHGIFSKGLNVLRDAGIERIFTKDGEVTKLKNINDYIGDLK